LEVPQRKGQIEANALHLEFQIPHETDILVDRSGEHWDWSWASPCRVRDPAEPHLSKLSRSVSGWGAWRRTGKPLNACISTVLGNPQARQKRL